MGTNDDIDFGRKHFSTTEQEEEMRVIKSDFPPHTQTHRQTDTHMDDIIMIICLLSSSSAAATKQQRRYR